MRQTPLGESMSRGGKPLFHATANYGHDALTCPSCNSRPFALEDDIIPSVPINAKPHQVQQPFAPIHVKDLYGRDAL